MREESDQSWSLMEAPAEAEANYYRQLAAQTVAVAA
jgi:hypothetical protein